MHASIIDREGELAKEGREVSEIERVAESSRGRKL